MYINNVGMASASCWWGRIAGSGLRLVHELIEEMGDICENKPSQFKSPDGRRSSRKMDGKGAGDASGDLFADDLPWSCDFDCVSGLAFSECWIRFVA